jgi:lysophospholipase L1-like esterase
MGAEQSSLERIAAQIDRFNGINQIEAERLGAYYIYVTSISREASFDRSLLASDGLHPSGKMYARWVNLVEPVACNILAR